MPDPADPNRPNDPHRQPFSQDIHHPMMSARVPEDIGRGVFATATMVLQTQDVFVVDFLSATVHPQQLVARVILTIPTFVELINALRVNIGMYEKAFGRTLLGPFVPPAAGHAPGQPPAPGQAPVPPAAPGHVPAPPAVAGPPAAPGQPVASAAAPGAPWSEPSAMAPPPVAGTPGMPGVAPLPPHAPPPVSEMPPQRADDLYDQLKLSDKMLGGVFSNVAMIRHTPEDFCIDFMANLYPRGVVTARVFLAAGRILPFVDTLAGAYERFRQRTGQGPAI